MCDVCKAAGKTDKIVEMTIFMAPFLVTGREHVNMLCDPIRSDTDRVPISPPDLFAHSQLTNSCPSTLSHLDSCIKFDKPCFGTVHGTGSKALLTEF